MKFPGKGERKKAPDNFVAAEDAGRHFSDAVRLIDQAVGVGWYEPGSDVDLAALTLCRLRRARAGERGGPEHGDEAVRAALAQASPEAVVWIASRAISHMDESGFPQAIELWFPEEERPGDT